MISEFGATGFTGIVWDAVPADRLARDLTTGPGPAPMAAAGLAYTALAAALGAAAGEYRAVLSALDAAWSSRSSADGLARLGELGDWLDRIGAAARHNAEVTGRQAAGYELAVVAMPPVADLVQAIGTAEDLLRGTLLGGPLFAGALAGVLDAAEHQLDELRTQAAQVMRGYEAASEPLAQPWEEPVAPAIADGAALLADRTTADAHRPGGPAADSTTVRQPDLQQYSGQPNPPVRPPLDLSALPSVPPAVPTVPVTPDLLIMSPAAPAPATVVVPQPVSVVPVAPQPVVAPPPVLPPAPGETLPGTGPLTTLRAAAADLDPDGSPAQVVVRAGFATVPAVLGGAAPAPAAVPVH